MLGNKLVLVLELESDVKLESKTMKNVHIRYNMSLRIFPLGVGISLLMPGTTRSNFDVNLPIKRAFAA